MLIIISTVMSVTRTLLCWMQSKRQPVWCASAWHSTSGWGWYRRWTITHFSTGRKKQDTEKKCLKARFCKKKKRWGKICCLFFSMHIFTYLTRKASHGEVRLSSPVHTFRAAQVGKLTVKACVGFMAQYGPFCLNWHLGYTYYLFLQGNKLGPTEA